MFGLSTKEKITKLIMDVSSEMIGVYKTALSSDNKTNTDKDNIALQSMKMYQDNVANECCSRLRKTDIMAGEIMSQALSDPTMLGFDEHDFDAGKNAGFVYCAAYYALVHELNQDMAYCVKMNHKQGELILKALNEKSLVNEVRQADKYNCFKKAPPKEADSLLAGVEKVCEMLFSNRKLYPNGENDVDKSRIVGLCAYLIAGWAPAADPKIASEVCRTYVNRFQLYDKPISYANEMGKITNDTYREIRSLTDTMEKTTRDVKTIVSGQARRFIQVSSIGEFDENVQAVEDAIYFFINQYLNPVDTAASFNSDKNVTMTVPSIETEDVLMNGLANGNGQIEESDTQTPSDEITQDVMQPRITPNISTSSDRICSSCGTQIPVGGEFCPKCGLKYIATQIEEKQTSHNVIDDKSVDQLKRLKQLYDDGILTQEEFAAKKRQILDL